MKQEIRVEVSAVIAAAPAVAYAILADYHRGHPAILPPAHFSDLVVERGGVGAGTEIRFRMRALGRSRTLRARIEEPEAGRVLAERYEETGALTTFTVEPSGRGSRVTIATAWHASGIQGWIERRLTPPLLKRIYTEELANLARAAEDAA